MKGAWQWLCGLFHAGEPVATRVGLLNTGELVLVSACGQAQVLSEGTTSTIRAVLYDAEMNAVGRLDAPR